MKLGKLLYYDIQSCALNNGWPTGFFGLGQGERQGCLTSYIYPGKYRNVKPSLIEYIRQL